jgi:hypothetical protein
MNATRFLGAALLLSIAVPAFADDGNFLYRLGRDTTSVEHYTRSAARLEIDQVGRAPRVLHRHYTYDYANGALTHLNVVVTTPGGASPFQTIDATADADSFRTSIQNGSSAAQHVAAVVPKSACVISGTSPWAIYEGVLQRFVAGKADTVSMPLYFLGAPNMNVLWLKKLGRDSVLLANDHLDVFHVKVDKQGRVQGVLPIAGTAKFGVTRQATLDVDAMAKAFAGREQSGTGLGTLSPRDTTRAENAGGASVWVDYSRPAMRGRDIYGGIVPYGEVWRTGANAATQLQTDRPLDFGGTVVPAGKYTLWSVVNPTSWKLLVNTQTGQWGTEHDAAKDAYTVAMTTSVLPEPVERFTIRVVPTSAGGVLEMDWASTRASAEFKAQPPAQSASGDAKK